MLLFSADGFDKALIFSSCQNLGTKYDFFHFDRSGQVYMFDHVNVLRNPTPGLVME